MQQERCRQEVACVGRDRKLSIARTKRKKFSPPPDDEADVLGEAAQHSVEVLPS